MAFWSGNKIAKEFQSSSIVEPFDASMINESAYTLTLGEQYFITPDHDVKDRDSFRKSLAKPTADNAGGPMAIPPGQFAFLLTEEYLEIPDNVMALISMRAGFKLNGLINVSGFHVDPGFRGRLVFAVYNAGPSPVNLSRGDELFLIWIADLDSSATDEYSRKLKPPQQEIGNDIIFKVNRPIHSLQNLSKKIDDLENNIKLVRNTAYVIGVVLALVVSSLALAYRFLPSNGQSHQPTTIDVVSPEPIADQDNQNIEKTPINEPAEPVKDPS